MVRVAFVCTENARRSQMAEAFMRVHAPEIVEAYSAGTHPTNDVDPLVREVLLEKGIDIRNQSPKSLADLPQDLDYVVTMGCGVECPIVPARSVIEWNIDDPKGKSIEEYRRIRDQIEAKVVDLAERILAEIVD